MATVDGKKELLFGKDFDPNDEVKMTTDVEGNPSVTINDKPASRMDYVDKMQENVERAVKGKKPQSFGYFSGVNIIDGKIVR